MKIQIPAWVDGTLQPVDKLQAHIDGLRHKAVSVFLVRDDQTLIQQRALTKYHTPGLWANTCCTHPKWDEPARDCAHRRLHEELGITGVEVGYRQTIEYRADVGNGMIEHEVVDVFCAEVPSDIPLCPNPDEVAAVKWISLAELDQEIAAHPEEFTPWLRIYLSKHRTAIFGQQTA